MGMGDTVTVMVVDDNEEYSRSLCDYIKLYDGFVSAGYALNGKEALELAMLTMPDVIILDLLMPQMDGLGFLRRLNAAKLRKKPMIIINSATYLNNMLDIAQKYKVDYITIKPQSFGDICAVIKDLTNVTDKSAAAIDEDKNKEEKHIADFLHHLGVPSHLSGYKYMRLGIKLAIRDMSILESITGRFYPAIAEYYNTNNCCVERAIRHAIGVSWTRGDKRLINDVFGYTYEDNARRPTNAEYMAMAADDFRIRFKYGAPI